MPGDPPSTSARAPVTSVLFGFGPMLPLVVAGAGAWVLPQPWPLLLIQLAITGAAVILAFIGGVRRGFGFGEGRASTVAEVVAAALYLLAAFAGLVVPSPSIALSILIVGYVLAALLDRRAALAGDAPSYFARLRPPQLLLGAAGLAGCWAWLLH